MENNELLHYGVKGMRWGHRKADPSYKKAHARTKVKYLSDKDLNDINKRLAAEKQYKSLTKRKSIGKKAIDSFVGTAATITAVTGAAIAYKKFGNQILDAIGNLKV